MKTKEIILVIENNKGDVSNYLCTFDDYMSNIVLRIEKDVMGIARHASALESTRAETEKWHAIYCASNKSFHARYCMEEKQLLAFLWGYLNENRWNRVFDREKSSKACLEKLKQIGLDTDGKMLPDFYETYEKLEKTFVQGEILHNFNGNNYRVMEKLTEKDLLLMDVKSGSFVVAKGTGHFAKYPKNENLKSDNCEIGIEWQHGIYLGNDMADIDFSLIREQHGMPKEKVIGQTGYIR